MSSKKLQFKMSSEEKTKKMNNDISQMSDISFDTLSITSNNSTDIQMMTPENSILQSLKNLMKLPVGGNALFPTRGEKVGDMLFTVGLSQSEAQAFILSYLNSNEPRITVHQVSGTKKVDEFNEQIVTLNVSYSFKNSDEIRNAIIELKASANISSVSN